MAYPFRPLTNETLKKLYREGPECDRRQRNQTRRGRSTPIRTDDRINRKTQSKS